MTTVTPLSPQLFPKVPDLALLTVECPWKKVLWKNLESGIPSSYDVRKHPLQATNHLQVQGSVLLHPSRGPFQQLGPAHSGAIPFILLFAQNLPTCVPGVHYHHNSRFITKRNSTIFCRADPDRDNASVYVTTWIFFPRVTPYTIYISFVCATLMDYGFIFQPELFNLSPFSFSWKRKDVYSTSEVHLFMDLICTVFYFWSAERP